MANIYIYRNLKFKFICYRKIQLYPNGKSLGMGSHISLYLALADLASLSLGSKVLVEFTLRLLDQVNGRHISGKGNAVIFTSFYRRLILQLVLYFHCI